MTMTNSEEIALLQHIMQNANWANIGDATGLRSSTVAGSVYIALCDADPGETGDLVNNEVTLAQYGQYTRIAVTRDNTEWVDNGANGLENANAVTFAQMTTGTGVTVTHFAVCKASTIATDDAIFTGSLGASLAISAGITPQFSAGDLDVSAD